MDWLDQYLHELHRPGAVVHLPPDKQSWHAPTPTKQQMSLMQDATIADMVRMRNIQEARQAEIDAGMGGAYDAGSAARERRSATAPALPAGYVTLVGLTWAPITGIGTYAVSQAYCANFTGLGFAAGTWRAGTAVELQSLAAALPVATAQSVYGWVFTNNFNVWSSESGRIINMNTGANNGTANTNNFNILCCKIAA